MVKQSVPKRVTRRQFREKIQVFNFKGSAPHD